MKKTIHILLLILAVSGLFYMMACEEVGPVINLNPKPVDTTLYDTTYVSSQTQTPDDKKVLIEDFTGVHCPNCPKAAIELEKLQSFYPGKIVAMSLHPEGINFTEPFPGRSDFRTEAATHIYEMLGKSIGLPAGAIDRIHFSGETYTLFNYPKWAVHVDDQLKKQPPLNIHLYANYNADSSDYAHVFVSIHYTEDVSDSHYVSIALTESNIIDWQIGSFSIIDSNYVHKHILRKMLTAYNGDFLMSQPEKGRTFVKEFKVKMNELWDPDNCSFVAFVHRRSYDFEVIQAEEIHLK